MANFDGFLEIGISDESGAGDRYQGGFSVNISPIDLPATFYRAIIVPAFSLASGSHQDLLPTPPVTASFLAATDPSTIGIHWFEKIWSRPQRLELGNIVTSITREIEIYNSWREEDRIWNSATNNAGPGVFFSGLPSFPSTINRQHSAIFFVLVSTSGPPVIDGTLDFGFDLGIVVIIPITGVRVVMFPYIPEQPIFEELAFRTNIIQATDGSEQRISLRKHPRQSFDLRVKTELGTERQRLQAHLFGWHPGVFGVPVWFEARYLGADAAAGAFTIAVDTTFGDFRLESLAIVWESSEKFNALEIESMTATSLTFSSPLTEAFTAGQALVIPLRVAVTGTDIDDARSLVNLDEIGIRFEVIDNQVDIGSTAAFATHNGKVLLEEPNLVAGSTLQDNLNRRIDRLDNEIGSLIQYTDWAASHFASRKGFLAPSYQRVWEVRQLMHALRGSQVTFYVPTFFPDLEVVGDLAVGSFLMDIRHIGYTSFVNGQEPNKSIWIRLVDGSRLTRQVTGAIELDADTERLTVDDDWPSTIPVGDIDIVSYLRRVRIADDRVRFSHHFAGSAEVFVETRGAQ